MGLYSGCIACTVCKILPVRQCIKIRQFDIQAWWSSLQRINLSQCLAVIWKHNNLINFEVIVTLAVWKPFPGTGRSIKRSGLQFHGFYNMARLFVTSFASLYGSATEMNDLMLSMTYLLSSLDMSRGDLIYWLGNLVKVDEYMIFSSWQDSLIPC